MAETLPESSRQSDGAAAIRHAVDVVREQIAAATARAGRPSGAVRLLPVSKTFPADAVAAAMTAGCMRFGENRVQEALQKYEYFAAQGGQEPEWSIIGHLQENKAKYVARFATEFQALDSIPLAAALDRRLAAAERRLDVLIQVNTSAEATKSGVRADEAIRLAEGIGVFPTLSLRGFMTIATHTTDEVEVRRCFALLRQVRDHAREALGRECDELSMGMSADFEWAIDEGATVVRVGSAIFGTRPLPPVA